MESGQLTAFEEALAVCKRSFAAVGVFSFFINILMLTPMFYMISVYDKAVATGSVPTLVALVVIAAFLYLVMGLLEWVRSIVLIHIGSRLDRLVAPRVYELCFRSEAGGIAALNVGSQPLSDLNSLRQFLASPSAAVIFDLPWIPLFLILMFFFHPALAAVAVVCIAIMTMIAIANQRSTTAGLKKANGAHRKISLQTQRNLRNAEVAAAMGMMKPLTGKWRDQQDGMLELQSGTSATASGFNAAIKTLQTGMQSAAITTGAVLAIAQEISPGLIIGAALLLGKTLQPIQQAVSGWKSFVEARDQYRRLNEFLGSFPPEADKMPLPALQGCITANQACVAPPGSAAPTVVNISFNLAAGSTTMVLGPSAAGKTTLVKAILGLWPTVQGDIRIDGTESKYFDRSELGPQLGYLPQDIELFDGTVADNIARFAEADPDLVVEAAMDAGVHDMILKLPEGYDTEISGSQGLLSPGQRQRVALARALYGRPKLLILDEPNSNLDESGEQALNTAIANMKQNGSSIIMVSHRQAVLSLADYVIIMENGGIKEQGARDEVIQRARAARQVKQAHDTQPAQIKAIPTGPPEK